MAQQWHPMTDWARARRIVRDDELAKTNMHLQAITQRIDTSEIRMIIDLTLRITDLALSSGASAAEATAMALRVMDSFKLQGHIDITYASVTISIPGGGYNDPVTAMRRARALATDYQRLAHLQALVGDLSHHTIDLRTARSRFNDLAVEPRAYRRWVVTVGSAFVGGANALMQGGGWIELCFVLAVCVLVDIAIRFLGRHRVPGVFTNLLAAMIPTTVGVLVMAFWPTSPMPSASIIVGAGIVAMLAGIGLTGAARDALDGYYITSGARMYEALVMTTGIVLGVLLTLWLGLRLGLPSYINPLTGSTHSMVLAVGCAGVVAVAFAITCYAGPSTLFLCLVLGALSQLGRMLGGLLTDYAPATAAVSALVVGAAAALAANWWKVPAAALIATGIVPQVPGSMIYRGVFFLLQSPDGILNTTSSTELLTALLTGMALAIGTSAGAILVRPFTVPRERDERRALGKSLHHNSQRTDRLPRA